MAGAAGCLRIRQTSGRAGRACSHRWCGRLARAVLRRLYLAHLSGPVHKHPMPFPTMPDPAADREREEARRHPERETLELAAAGAAKVLGEDHGVTKALARAATTMAKVDLWRGSGTTIT